jgi:hypothetical protein
MWSLSCSFFAKDEVEAPTAAAVLALAATVLQDLSVVAVGLGQSVRQDRHIAPSSLFINRR